MVAPIGVLTVTWSAMGCSPMGPVGYDWDRIMTAFTTAPVLTHWIPETQITIETDASDYALAAVLSITTQMANCTRLHSTPEHFPPRNSITMFMTKSYSQFLKPSNVGNIILKALHS